jgi:hypothetical protein
VETDSLGRFAVRAWRADSFRLDVAHPAYRAASVEVQAGLGERVEVTITLSAEAVELPAVEVRGRARLELGLSGLAGFAERRRWGELLGVGRYLGQAELDRGGGSVHDILGNVPELRSIQHPTCPHARILTVGRSVASLRSIQRQSVGRGIPRCQLSEAEERALGICRVQIVIDGVRMPLSGDDSVNEMLSPGVLAAAEIYATAADLPAEYAGMDSRCGVVAIWTRRGAR